jgi:hypothetical protein
MARLPRLKLAALSFRLLPFAVLAVVFAGSNHPAHGGIWVQPVIEDSPMIKKGHLDGGINGEGANRKDGKTPMMLAVEAHQLDVIDYLLTNGADLSLKDADGETAMDIARRTKPGDVDAKLGAYLAKHPNPSEYYAAKAPVLAIVSGRAQSGSPDCGAPGPLVVSVADKDGHPLVDAPVKFAVQGGGQHLLTGASSPDSSSLLLRTDAEGHASANVHLPKTPGERVLVIASAGIGGTMSKVAFTAAVNDDTSGTGSDSTSCFNPTDQSATLNGDGSIDVSWVNHTDDETCIKIWVRTPGAWKLALTVPAHSTSAHIPPP